MIIDIPFEFFFVPQVVFLLVGILCIAIRVAMRKRISKPLWPWSLLTCGALWIILSRNVMLHSSSNRYMSLLLPLGIPIVTLGAESLLELLRGLGFKRITFGAILLITCISMVCSFAKLARFNASKPKDFRRLSAALTGERRYPDETLYVLDVAKEYNRLEHYLDASNICIEPYMNQLLDRQTFERRWNKIDEIANKTDTLYALVNKKEAGRFLQLQNSAPSAWKISWRVLTTTSRHQLLQGKVLDDRYGQVITPDEFRVGIKGKELLWDGRIDDVTPLHDKSCIAVIRKNGFSAADDLIFPRSWFINPGHGFYNREPQTIAKIDCRKHDRFCEIIFTNEGKRAFGGIYSTDVIKLPRGAEGRVVFRGKNGGRFSILARVLGPDKKDIRTVKIKSFCVLRQDTWYLGKFVFDEKLSDGEQVGLIICFDGGTVAIADLSFWSAEK